MGLMDKFVITARGGNLFRFFFFFFQAEDGIRDRNVTGVQTCALPICSIPVGCDVWKTDDPALRKRLEQTYSQDKPARRVPVTATVAGRAGGPLTLTFTEIGRASCRERGEMRGGSGAGEREQKQHRGRQ